MKIIVTEKPSVAREYAKVLDIHSSSKEEGLIRGISSLDNTEYVITHAIGHLVTLSYPEVYDESLKKWDINDLPFLPKEYLYEVLKDTKKQFNVIKKLYNDKDAEVIYYAGDSAREGIYIQHLIRMMSGVKNGVKELVVWINSQTKEEILRGIKEAKPLSEYQNLIDSAYARAIEDYAVGINFSRAFSIKYGYKLNNEAGTTKYKPISIGRVMTCVLGMIVQRENEIRNFTETLFYKIVAKDNDTTYEWKIKEGSKYYNSNLIYDNKGFLNKEDAYGYIEELNKNQILTVTKVDKKTEKKNAPLLYNLAELQNDCAKIYKISPDMTLQVVQSLYEGKFVTYPRTDARVLSSSVAKEISANLRGLRNGKYLNDKAEYVLYNKRYVGLEKTFYVNDSKISDHYAIIPTGEGNYETLEGLNKSIYELIVRRFLSIFYDSAEYEKIEIECKHSNGEMFTTSSKVLTKLGYLEIANSTAKTDEISPLSNIKVNNTINVIYDVNEGKTTPPKRYTSGSIILAMENAGNLIEDEELRSQIKGSGIGTSATRAEIIKKLSANEYIKIDKKTQSLSPLILGDKIYEIVNEVTPELLYPKMTASWEKGLSAIEEGTISKTDYLDTLNEYITKEVEKIKSKQVETFTVEKVGVCPFCNNDIVTTKNGYKCANYSKDNGCNFYISKIPVSELNNLLTNGQTNFMKMKNKEGKTYEGAFKIGDNEITRVFPERKEEESSFLCPKCGNKLVKTLYNLKCECEIKLPLEICGKKLSDKDIEMLIKGKTDEIKGFKSKKGKLFTARLYLDEDYNVKFDFGK